VTKQGERQGADQERKASDLAKELAHAQHDVGVKAGELKSLEDTYRSLRSKYYTLQDNLNQQVAQRSAFFECM
jgi:chromosome segregation ATPase